MGDDQVRQQPAAAAAPAPEREAAGSARGGALHRDLRGATFAEGQALLRPEGPVQRQERAGGAAESVDEQVPDQVNLDSLRVSFTIPAGKTLSGSWERDVRTTSPTLVTLGVDRDGLRVSFSPALYIDAQWPAHNMRVWRAGRSFTRASTSAEVSIVRGLGEGFLDMSGTAETQIKALIDGAIAGTAMAGRGYDPFGDREILSTLNAIKANFDSLPAAGGGGDVGAAELTRPTLGATLTMNAPFEHLQDGVGLRVPSGGSFDASIMTDGNLAALMGARSAGEVATSVTVDAIRLSSSAIVLIKDGDELVRLEQLTVHRGGRVTLDRFTLLGSGATAAGVEALIRLFAGAAALAGRGAPPRLAVGLAARDANPDFVEGLTRSQVEEGLTEAVQQLVTQNRNAVPGLDLASALGM